MRTRGTGAKTPEASEAFHVARGMKLDQFGSGAAPSEEGGRGEPSRAARPQDAPPFFTVSQLTDLIEEDLHRDDRLRGVWVKGEISGLREYPKAWYFTLKDTESQVSAVCWNYGAQREVGP